MGAAFPVAGLAVRRAWIRPVAMARLVERKHRYPPVFVMADGANRIPGKGLLRLLLHLRICCEGKAAGTKADRGRTQRQQMFQLHRVPLRYTFCRRRWLTRVAPSSRLVSPVPQRKNPVSEILDVALFLRLDDRVAPIGAVLDLDVRGRAASDSCGRKAEQHRTRNGSELSFPSHEVMALN